MKHGSSASILFLTNQDMQNSPWLAEGMIVKTLSSLTLGDGGGNYWQILNANEAGASQEGSLSLYKSTIRAVKIVTSLTESAIDKIYLQLDSYTNALNNIKTNVENIIQENFESLQEGLIATINRQLEFVSVFETRLTEVENTLRQLGSTDGSDGLSSMADRLTALEMFAAGWIDNLNEYFTYSKYLRDLSNLGGGSSGSGGGGGSYYVAARNNDLLGSCGVSLRSDSSGIKYIIYSRDSMYRGDSEIYDYLRGTDANPSVATISNEGSSSVGETDLKYAFTKSSSQLQIDMVRGAFEEFYPEYFDMVDTHKYPLKTTDGRVTISYIEYSANTNQNGLSYYGGDNIFTFNQLISEEFIFINDGLLSTSLDFRQMLSSGTEPYYSFVIPANAVVTDIDEWAFYGCVNLISVKFGNNLLDIHPGAFMNCINLRYIDYSDSAIERIGEGAFINTNVAYAIVPPTITDFGYTIPYGLYMADSDNYLDYYNPGGFISWDDLLNEGYITVNNGVLTANKKLSDHMVEYERAFGIRIADTVTAIGDDCFRVKEGADYANTAGYEYLIKIDFAETVAIIGSGAFYGSSANTYYIPDGCTIRTNAFRNISALDVYMSDDVTYVSSSTDSVNYSFPGDTTFHIFDTSLVPLSDSESQNVYNNGGYLENDSAIDQDYDVEGDEEEDKYRDTSQDIIRFTFNIGNDNAFVSEYH